MNILAHLDNQCIYFYICIKSFSYCVFGYLDNCFDICIVGKYCMSLLKYMVWLLKWLSMVWYVTVFAFSFYLTINSITCCIMNIVKNCLSIYKYIMDSNIYLLDFILALWTIIIRLFCIIIICWLVGYCFMITFVFAVVETQIMHVLCHDAT